MTNQANNYKTIGGLIVAAACFRFLPHPPNFSPIYSMAIFGGMSFPRMRDAILTVLGAMLVSDFVIGFDVTSPLVYLSLLAIIGIGVLFRQHKNLSGVLVASTFGSVLFFVVSNLAVWLGQSLYPKNVAGLVECFVMALPFFPMVLLSSILFSSLLWGAYSKSCELESFTFSPSRS